VLDCLHGQEHQGWQAVNDSTEHDAGATPRPLSDRRRLQAVHQGLALAGWCALPALRQREGLHPQAGLEMAVPERDVRQERLSLWRANRNHFREHEIPAAHVVRDWLPDLPEQERHQRSANPPADRQRRISDSVVYVPPFPRRDAEPRVHQTDRRSRSR
jgi:hypothetical protein